MTHFLNRTSRVYELLLVYRKMQASSQDIPPHFTKK